MKTQTAIKMFSEFSGFFVIIAVKNGEEILILKSNLVKTREAIRDCYHADITNRYAVFP